jgi:exodeoxyribonuclease III
VKIATWNVNSIKVRLPIVVEWLQTHAPDVLMLQEIKTLDFPKLEFEQLGYRCEFVGQKSYNGVATLAKKAGGDPVTMLAGDTEDDHARFLAVTIDGVRVINIYLPNGNPIGTEKFAYKLAWMQRLKTEIQSMLDAEIPFVIGGDFNVIPDDIDCSDPRLWRNDALAQPETRALWRSMLHLGTVDAFRALDPRPGQYTFWDYQAGAWRRNIGIRIDHFLTSPQITDRIAACEIDKAPRALEKASDHTPVVLTLRG